jgi:hypothetical protein
MVLLNSLWKLFLVLINPILSVPAAIVIAIFIWKNQQYKHSAYYKITKRSYLSMALNVGLYGEYLIYNNLKAWEKYGAKFLFNVYVPTADGRTSEIDVLMINAQGIYVFESKNYSGWIFGNENQKNWHQTFPAGRGRSRKESFYNPIMQNRSHIKHLQAYLGVPIPMYSMIVFSDRCTLRNITFNSNCASVINRNEIEDAVHDIYERVSANLLTEHQIDEIYNKLYPLTQVDEFTKAQHIETIQQNLAHASCSKNPQDLSEAQRYEDADRIPAADRDIVANAPEERTVTELRTPTEDIEAPICVNTLVEPLKPLCPHCGGTLIIRTATRGANAGNRFYGCTNYPRCKYIQNIAHETV